MTSGNTGTQSANRQREARHPDLNSIQLEHTPRRHQSAGTAKKNRRRRGSKRSRVLTFAQLYGCICTWSFLDVPSGRIVILRCNSWQPDEKAKPCGSASRQRGAEGTSATAGRSETTENRPKWCHSAPLFPLRPTPAAPPRRWSPKPRRTMAAGGRRQCRTKPDCHTRDR